VAWILSNGSHVGQMRDSKKFCVSKYRLLKRLSIEKFKSIHLEAFGNAEINDIVTGGANRVVSPSRR
jgi:hypothetical protein